MSENNIEQEQEDISPEDETVPQEQNNISQTEQKNSQTEEKPSQEKQSSQTTQVADGIDEHTKNILESWDELKGIDLFSFYETGWKPRVKRDREGRRYISLRRNYKGEGGRWKHEERGLGVYDPERFQILVDLYPREDIFPKSPTAKLRERGQAITSSKIIKPIPPSVNFDLETLSYYKWAQGRGFKGSLGDFVNQTVKTFFLEHGLEIVVEMVKK